MRRRLINILSRVSKKFISQANGSCAVLLYHRINNLHSDPQLLSVSPHNFDKQLNYLKNNYPVLQIEELKFHIEKKKKLPPKSIALTFDDGYADNYLEATPILEQHKLQALIYVATGTLNTPNEFWWDAVERILLQNDNSPLARDYKVENYKIDLNNLNQQGRVKLYEKLLPLFRGMLSSKRENKIVELSQIFNCLTPRPTHRALSFDELRKLNSSKSIVVGAHTHLHPSLAALNYEQQLSEIKTSKEILERELNQPIIHFSYPFGTLKDYNSNTLQICRQLNFEMVAANYPYIAHKNSNIFQVPRFLVRNWDEKTFKMNLNSFFA